MPSSGDSRSDARVEKALHVIEALRVPGAVIDRSALDTLENNLRHIAEANKIMAELLLARTPKPPTK